MFVNASAEVACVDGGPNRIFAGQDIASWQPTRCAQVIIWMCAINGHGKKIMNYDWNRI
jgi:hypothetical protein